MDIDKAKPQIAKWASQASASARRACEYGERAEAAAGQILELAPKFVDAFNQIEKVRLRLDSAAVIKLVQAYNRELIDFKLRHGISPDQRVDTYICAGLWFCRILNTPCFRQDDDAGTPWDMANPDHFRKYHWLIGKFAFYFSFRVLRGHYKKYQETTLLRLLLDLRNYMCNHYDSLASSQAAAVGIFLTISLFDKVVAAKSPDRRLS